MDANEDARLPHEIGEDVERRFVGVVRMALEAFENIELAAFNNAVTGWGRVEKENLAYKRAVDAALIEPSGSVHSPDLMKRALAGEIRRRVDAGTFT